jgi:hypothetical protein
VAEGGAHVTVLDGQGHQAIGPARDMPGQAAACVRTCRVQRICVVIRAGIIRVVKFALVMAPGVAIPAAAV